MEKRYTRWRSCSRLWWPKMGEINFQKMSCMSASSCNQSIYFHLAMHVLNTLFRGSVSRACVLTHAINTSNKRMNGLEKLFIASLFSQPKLEMRNVTIRGRNLFIFFLSSSSTVRAFIELKSENNGLQTKTNSLQDWPSQVAKQIPVTASFTQ